MKRRVAVCIWGAVALLLQGAASASPKTPKSPVPFQSPSPTPSPSVSVLPSPSPDSLPSSAVGATPGPFASLTALQIKQLAKEYSQALVAERMALEHRQKFELMELKASQDARLKEWKSHEAQELRRLRQENKTPAEIRSYVKDRNIRYNGFQAMMKDERKQRAQGHQVRLQALRTDQEVRRKEFDSYLKRGEVPPNRLWPKPGQ